MRTVHFLVLCLYISLVGCQLPQGISNDETTHVSSIIDTLDFRGKMSGRGALLLTKYKSLEDLKNDVEIIYTSGDHISAWALSQKSSVQLTYNINGEKIISILKEGISETDFSNAKNGKWWNKLFHAVRSPYAVWNKENLKAIESLGRRRPWVFGKGDAAFYDLAETMVHHISDEDTIHMTSRDLSEKGYLNTFNHIAAQAFMTSIFSERIADFVADVHERRTMPELITGKFSKDQIADLENGPVDNYIDILNNEWGQELGKELRKKYALSRNSYWTPELLTNYLNDIQSYHSWAFQIGFKPFRETDEIVIKFAAKINKVIAGV